MTEPVEVESKVQSGRILGHKETRRIPAFRSPSRGARPRGPLPSTPLDCLTLFSKERILPRGSEGEERRPRADTTGCAISSLCLRVPGSGWAAGTGHAVGECRQGRERKKCFSSPRLLAATFFPSHLLVPRHRKTFLLVLRVQNNPLKINTVHFI